MKTHNSAQIVKCFFALLLLLYPSFNFSQTDKALFTDLSEKNRKSAEALALYPKDTRLAILETTKYPEALSKMQNLKEKNSAAFRTLIKNFSREDQTAFYDITRYPGLVEKIAQNKGDKRKVRDAMDVMPDDQRDKALPLVNDNMAVVVRMDELNRNASKNFEAIFASYNGTAQSAFRNLLDIPEVIDILNEDRRFTERIGGRYKADPAAVIQEIDSLNLVVARNNAQELKEWKKNIDSDPEAKAELKSASQEYAAEYNYDDEYYDYTASNYAMEHYYFYHYPYWYGYPWWDPYPRWRPYPYWYDWGYNYYGPSYNVVYMPSYHFMHWYFYHPGHHYHYNHLSTVFVNHYYGHRGSGTTIASGVRDWQVNNSNIVTDDFVSDKTKLPERLKEFGQLEEERQNYNKKQGRDIPQSEFLQKNGSKYPGLALAGKTAGTGSNSAREQVIEKTSTPEPKKPVAKSPEPAKSTAPVRKTPPTERSKPPVMKEEREKNPPVAKPERIAPPREAPKQKQERTAPPPPPRASQQRVEPRQMPQQRIEPRQMPQQRNDRPAPKRDKNYRD